MPHYRCNACEFVIDAKFAPFQCPSCRAKGKGFIEAEAPAATATQPPATSNAVVAAPLDPQGVRTVPVRSAAIVPEPTASIAIAAVAAPAAPPAPAAGSVIASSLVPPEIPQKERPRAEEPAAERRAPAPAPARQEPDRLAWRYAAPVTSNRPLRSCPAVDAEGRVFVSIQNRLVMFDARAQSPQWEYVTAASLPRSPALGSDGLVRVHSSDGYLHVVDAGGRPAHAPVEIGEPLGWASPLVDEHGNTWICASAGGLVKIQPDGQRDARPFFRTRRRFDCTGLIYGDVLYVGCEDHFVYAISLVKEHGENAWAVSPELGRTGCSINNALALKAGPELLAASHDDFLHAFSLDGRSLWATALGGQLLGAPVVDNDGTVFAGVSQNRRNQPTRGALIAVDKTSHQIKWQFVVDCGIESTPVIGDDGILYFGDNNGSIHAVDIHGKPVWTSQFAAPVRSPGTIIGPGLVAFGLDSGELVVLNCSSQRVRAGGWPKFQQTLEQSGTVCRQGHGWQAE